MEARKSALGSTKETKTDVTTAASKLLLHLCEGKVAVPLIWRYANEYKMWVKVKSVYTLTITSAEKTALTSMLNTC